MRTSTHVLLACTAASLLIVTGVAAHAAPIVNTTTIPGNTLAATSVDGIIVNGTVYDVTVADNGNLSTTPPDLTFFGNAAGAISAADQLSAALQLANVEEFQGTHLSTGQTLLSNNLVIISSLCPDTNCPQGPYVGEESNRTTNGSPWLWQTSDGIGIVPNDVFALFSVAPPTATVTTTPSGLDTEYAYSFTGLSGSGNVFIPILDLAGIVGGSLPGDVTLITDPATILADWPGSGNSIPGSKSIFDDPEALLEIPDSGAASFSFLDSDPSVNGPILADGSLLDPPVPGAAPGAPAPAPEPGSLLLLAVGSAGLSLIRRHRKSGAARS